MKIEAHSVEEYISNLPEDRVAIISKLRSTILENLPDGFQEMMNYGMLGYVVPQSIYPDGYHCDPKLPLPFINVASQKNFVAIYHMGIYANPELLNWFITEYANRVKGKLDMGKSCIRLKKMDQIPYDLIAELVQKLTVQQWIELYEEAFRKSKVN